MDAPTPARSPRRWIQAKRAGKGEVPSRHSPRSGGAGMFGADVRRRVLRAVGADRDVMLYAARVSVRARWLVWVVAVAELAYRPQLWWPTDKQYLLLNVPLVRRKLPERSDAPGASSICKGGEGAVSNRRATQRTPARLGRTRRELVRGGHSPGWLSPAMRCCRVLGVKR